MSDEHNPTAKRPLVSCLMVTANRKHLMRRSIHCFTNQSYADKEMVIVDDGEQDLEEVLQEIPSDRLTYIKLEPSEENTLGTLRNLSLEKASGELLIQWDDDDWYHPERIKTQVEVLNQGYDACCLSGALMHLDTDRFMEHPYVGHLPDGVPGSIMHRRSSTIRYPDTRRAEDTVYLDEWREKRYRKLPDKHSYLFLRAYHGDNTWERDHFERRIRNTPKTFLQYLWHAKIKGNLFDHPKFELTDKEEESFQMFMEDSRRFNLI